MVVEILMKLIHLVLILLTITFAMDTIAIEYPYIYRSAYFLGRGDTGIAVADDEDSIFYNPAGLAQGTGIYKRIIFASPMIEVSQNTRDVVKQIQVQDSDPTETLRKQLGRPQHFGLNFFSGIILRRVAIGVFSHNATTTMLFKDYEKGAFESVMGHGVTDVGVTFSLAQNWGDKMFFGLTTKYLKRNEFRFEANATEGDQLSGVKAADITMTGTAVGADVGFMYNSGGRSPLMFGVTIQDVGHSVMIPDVETSVSKSDRPLKDLRQTVNIGIAFAPGTKISKFKLMIDYRDALNETGMSDFKKIHGGMELSVRDFIGFTAGINQGYPTFGAYFDSRLVRLDIGSYGEEVGDLAGSRPDIRYYFRLTAGL